MSKVFSADEICKIINGINSRDKFYRVLAIHPDRIVVAALGTCDDATLKKLAKFLSASLGVALFCRITGDNRFHVGKKKHKHNKGKTKCFDTEELCSIINTIYARSDRVEKILAIIPECITVKLKGGARTWQDFVNYLMLSCGCALEGTIRDAACDELDICPYVNTEHEGARPA